MILYDDVRIYPGAKDYATTTYNDQQWLLGRPRSFEVSVSAQL